MEFVVIAYDGDDHEALQRRLAVRQAHIELIDSLKAKGHFQHAGAILDDAGKMIGSVLVCDFPSRKELDDWLAIEPYVVGNVWDKIHVMPYRTGPAFVPPELVTSP